MSLTSRTLRRSVFGLFCLLSSLCAAQSRQFLNVPEVQPVSGRVSSFLTGTFQSPADLTDILYVDAPVVAGTSSSVTAGVMLNSNGQNFTNLTENQIVFQNATAVIPALGDFNGDGITDFAFAFVPQGTKTIEICVYYGTGATAQSNLSSFAPLTGKSGCEMIPSNESTPPVLSYMVSFPLATTSPVAQLLLEDSANNLFYLVAENGVSGSNGVLTGYTTQVGLMPGGAGPIYVGDFDGDGFNDFIINGQSSETAAVYLSSSALSTPRYTYAFDHNVHSLLVHDMDGDGHPDLVVEGDNGVIEIFKGTPGTSSPFQTSSEGGTPAGGNALAGVGGHLAAIDPNTLDILTTTPIGLSVLEPLSGTLNYGLQGIYNIGPGRTSYALAAFFGAGSLDFAVDSPEGIAIVAPNGGGGFLTSNGYSALAPALSATVGKFRSAAHNPAGDVDVVVATGATQAQLLQGNGNGTFTTFSGVVDTSPPATQPFTAPPADVWSNILSGDFDGDGNLDVLYSLTGLPQPPPGQPPLAFYIQYGNGDGTFSQVGNPIGATALPANPDGLYVESAVGDFNGDGIPDVAASNAFFDGTWLGQTSRSGLGTGLVQNDSSNTDFSQVAAGFFKVNRSSQQDLVFQQGASFIPYANKQDGTGKNFTAEPALMGPGAPLYPATVLLTDVDGDGNGDLVVVYYNSAYNPLSASPVAPNQVYIWWGNGDGTFVQTPLVLSPSRNYYLGAVRDMNGDGRPDLVLSDGSLISILYGQGNRSFGTVLANGEYSSEVHYLAGQGINSISIADVNGDGEPDLVVANGGATISNALALGGATATSLSLPANPDVNTGGITVLINSVTTKPVTGTLVASPEPSIYAATFTLTATLESSPGVAEPTGPVQFTIDGNNLGSPVALVPGATASTATYTVPAGNLYTAGVHPITAIYYGDAANSPLTLAGLPGTHAIVGGTTTTVLYLCPGPSPACPATGFVMPPFTSAFSMYYGQDWNGTVVVTASDGGPIPGTVSIYDAYTGTAPAPPSPLCTLPAGTGGSCPAAVGTTEGTSVGVNVITATYSGDSTHTGSTSGPVTITVLEDTTAATLAGSPNPSPLGQPVTFTATLTGNYAAPSGTVQFVELFPPTASQVLLGTATLAPGSGLNSTATFTTTALPLGVDSIQAVYGGTTDFAAANSPVITETITPSIAGSFTLTVAPTPVSVGVGTGALLLVTVAPQNGFSQAVNLTCSNLPYEATCVFVNPSIAGGGGQTTLIVETTPPHSCGSSTPYFYGGLGSGPLAAPFALPALAGLVLLCVPGRRRWLRALVVVAAVAAGTQITGCTTCTDLGTRPATYTIQVTGTAATSAEVQSQSVTITVTI